MRAYGVLAVVVLAIACGGPVAPRPPRRPDAAVVVREAGADAALAATIGSLLPADAGEVVDAAIADAAVADAEVADAPALDSSCGPVSRACVGGTLISCGAEGQSTSSPCPQGCNETTLLCNVCPPNARTCSDGTQTSCRADGTGTDSLPCMNGCNAATGECNGCLAGTSWCNGDTLRECTASGQERDKQVCSFGCDGVRMACNACKPGNRACSGDTLVLCKADGSASANMPCTDGCNLERRACNRCRPNTRRCDGLTIEVCKADGSGFTEVPGTDCKKPLGTMCGSNGECASSFCVHGLCCNAACDGVCLSCVSGETGGAQGICAPVRADTNPHDQCPATGCASGGQCDGTGRCRLSSPDAGCLP